MSLRGPAAGGHRRDLLVVVLVVLCGFGLGARSGAGEAGPPTAVRIGGRRIPVVQYCDADLYDCALEVPVPGERQIYWGWQDERNHYRLDLGTSGAVLTRVLKGEATRLASAPEASAHSSPAVGGAPCSLVLRRRAHALTVILNGRILFDCLDATFSRGAVAGAGLKLARFQPAEEASFSDDFMRAEKDQDLGSWTKIRGAWRFHSVKDTNPDADFSRSVNPFSLGGSDAQGALVTAGFPFWSDYACSVSLKSAGAVAGLAFAYRAPDDYFLLRLDLRGIRPGPAGVELLHVLPAGPRRLAAGTVRAASGAWYRLGVRLSGPRIQAILDGSILFDVVDRQCLGGPIGLYTQGAAETFFDDVDVETPSVYPFDRVEVLRRSGAPLGSAWTFPPAPGPRIAGDTGPHLLAHHGGALARYLLGDAQWQGGVIQARVRAEGSDGWAGLLYGYQDERNWRLARWRVGSGASAPGGHPAGLELLRCSGGKTQVLAAAPAGITPGRWHELQLDCTPEGFTQVSLDGRLRLRVPEPDVPRGRAGVYSWRLSGVAFQAPTLRRAREVQVEQPLSHNQIFAADPYMRLWSSPQGQWLPAKGDPHLYWNKGDFFDTYSIGVPVQPGLTLAFAADTQELGRGYQLAVEAAKGEKAGFSVRLSRLGKPLKSATLSPQSAAEKVLLWHSGDVVWATAAGKQLFCLHDREPLPGRCVGVSAPTGFDVGSLDVRRENVIDYPFEEAPCDWDEYGNWLVTNRFSCTPTWSHLAALSEEGSAALWNKYAYDGDVTLEFYAGMRMRTPTVTLYQRVGDINVTLAGEGPDLASGYSYIIGAWDRVWSEKWTRLLRAGRSVAQTDRYLAPRVREPMKERAIDVPWIAAGRPIHGAWYYIKVRKVGRRVECFFDNEKVFAYDDPRPLTGRQFALWTLHNQIVIAKARVTYQRRTAPQRLLATARPTREPLARPLPSVGAALAPAAGPAVVPAPVLTSATHPGMLEDFERPGSGWEPLGSPRDVAVERVPGGPVGSRACLRVTGCSPGADLAVKVPVPAGLDAGRAILQFDYRVPAGVRLHLYVSLGGKLHFVRMVGDEADDPLLPLLGEMAIQADGRWHRARFDLGAAAAHLSPTGQPLPVQEIRLGYCHQGYVRAGIGANAPGASYYLDNFLIASASAAAPVLTWAASGPAGSSLALSWDRSPERGGSATKAAEALPPRAPRTRGERWRSVAPSVLSVSSAAELRAPRPGAGLGVRSEPNGTAPGALQGSRSLKGLADGLWFAHARVRRPDGTWGPAAHLPFYAATSAPVLQPVGLPADGRWGGESLLFQIAAPVRRPVDVAHLSLTVNGQSVSDAARLAGYDARTGRLTLDLQRSGLTFSDRQEVKVALQAPTLGGAPASGQLSLTMERSRDRRPPDAPMITSPGLLEGFEQGVGTWSGSSSALVMRDPATAAAGKASLRVVNQTVLGPFLANALSTPFNAGSTPLLHFAYRVPEGVCVSLGLDTRQGQAAVRFADPDDDLPVLGTIPDVRRDGQWHVAQVNLREALGTLRLAPDQYRLADLFLSDRGYANGAPGASYWIDDFRLVPAVSASVGIPVAWTASDPSGIAAARYRWSTRPDDQPDTLLPGAATGYTFRNIPEGLVTLHLQVQDGAGNWSEAAHVPFLVDNTPPVVGTPTSGKLGGSMWELPLSDAGSGIDPASLKARVNGQPFALGEFLASYDAGRKLLSWEWPLASGLFSGPIPDGQPVEIALEPVKDFAGNATAPIVCRYTVDRASDHEPPRAPTLRTPPPTTALLDTFTRDVGPWVAHTDAAMPRVATWLLAPDAARQQERARERSDIPSVERFLDPERRDYCARLAISPGVTGYARPASFDAAKVPYLAFDYCCPPGVGLHLMLLIGGQPVEIPLSAAGALSPKLPQTDPAPGFRADGKWHTLALNYFELIRKAGYGKGATTVSLLLLRHQGTPGQAYEIDNFQVFGPGPSDLQVSWQAADTTGIQGYRYHLTQDPDAGDDPGTDTAERGVSLQGLQPGLWLLRVRARDGAGNWSAPALLAHYVSR